MRDDLPTLPVPATFRCPSCRDGRHRCPDTFEHETWGHVACGCQTCWPEERS